MKAITIKNIHIQIDGHDEDHIGDQVERALSAINKTLAIHLPDLDPRLFYSHIDVSDVEVEELDHEA